MLLLLLLLVGEVQSLCGPATRTCKPGLTCLPRTGKRGYCGMPTEALAVWNTSTTAIFLPESDLEGNVTALAALTHLEELDLSKNRVLTKGPLWFWLENLRKLRVLKLAACGRTGRMDVIKWQYLSALEILELNDNKFEEGVLPGTLATLTRLEMLNLANTQRAGDLAAFDFSGMSAIQQIKLAGNAKFLPGKIPASLSTLTTLKLLSLRDTNRAGDMGDFNVTNLKTTLLSFNLADNPGFAAGPVPAYFQELTLYSTRGFGSGAHYASVKNTNLQGPVDPTTCIRELSKSTTYQCECDATHTGRRCQTCIGCADGLACKDGQAGVCTVAEGSLMATFGAGVTAIHLSDQQLHGDLPDMSSLVALESLDVSDNPTLAAGPAWPWLFKMQSLKSLNISNTSRTTQPYGQRCSADGSDGSETIFANSNQCVPGSMCRTHCCGLDPSPTCSYCTNDDSGSCYTPLSVDAGWDAVKPALNSSYGWVPRYSKGESKTLRVPSNMASFVLRGGDTVPSSKVVFKLMWSENSVVEVTSASTPPHGLSPSGTALDPEGFLISKTGHLDAAPQRNGNFTAWLLASDVSGRAEAAGLPKELDQVVLNRFEFSVTGKPDFSVVGHNATAQVKKCLLGIACTLVPFNVSDLTYRHLNGRREDVRFMITNAPRGFFIESFTGIVHADIAEETLQGGIQVGIFAVDSVGDRAPMLHVTYHFDVVRFELSETYMQCWELRGPSQRGQHSIEVGQRYNWHDFAGPVTDFNQCYLGENLGENGMFTSQDVDVDEVSYKIVWNASTSDPAYAYRKYFKVDYYGDLKIYIPDDVNVPEDLAMHVPIWSFYGDQEVHVLDWHFNLVKPAVDSREAPTVLTDEWDAAMMEQGIRSTYAIDNSTFLHILGPEHYMQRKQIFVASDSRHEHVVYKLELFDAEGLEIICLNHDVGFTPTPTSADYNVSGSGSSSGSGSGSGSAYYADYRYTNSSSCPEYYTADDGSILMKFEKEVPPESPFTARFIAYAVRTYDWNDDDVPAKPVVLKSWDFSVQHQDTDVAENGPNRKGCGPGTPVDDLAFDRNFTCNCLGTEFEGDNCDAEPHASALGLPSDSGPVIGGVLGTLLVLVAVLAAMNKVRMHQLSLRAHDFQLEIDNLVANGELDEGQVGDGKIPREVKRGNVTPISVVGSGAFGEVWKGMLDESSAGGVPSYMVAIKTSIAADGEGAAELHREAALMAVVAGHQNLVSLVGVVTSGVPLMLLMSYCEHGNLQSYLRSRRWEEQKPVPLPTKLQICADVARGMRHLSAARFIHRDLAARNVLLDSGLTGKVADFGLSRVGNNSGATENATYYRSTHGMFAVRWTSPEAMETNVFSQASDAWSYGIVMFEVMDDGMTPYDGLGNAEVMQKIQAGYRLPAPASCTAGAYRVMMACWQEDPASRPTFDALLTEVLALGDACPPISSAPTSIAFNPQEGTARRTPSTTRPRLESTAAYTSYTATNPLYKPSGGMDGGNASGPGAYIEIDSESDPERTGRTHDDEGSAHPFPASARADYTLASAGGPALPSTEYELASSGDTVNTSGGGAVYDGGSGADGEDSSAREGLYVARDMMASSAASQLYAVQDGNAGATPPPPTIQVHHSSSGGGDGVRGEGAQEATSDQPRSAIARAARAGSGVYGFTTEESV